MPPSLASLRETPQPDPALFLKALPGCWIQYYDDTPAKDPAKALSARAFDPATAHRKQEDCCAVCFSLQAFNGARTKEELLCFRNLGVDVDLVPAAERYVLTLQQIDQRKEEYLMLTLHPFPLRPHWLIETRHGFHIVYRIRPLRDAATIREAQEVNRRLVDVLRGDRNAVLLTQVLRVPGSMQFKNPECPFQCRLLQDSSALIHPYDVRVVRGVLDAWEECHGLQRRINEGNDKQCFGAASGSRPWQDSLDGVPEGHRNASAAAIVGAILGRLPEHLWELAGWGGLLHWNQRNAVPLPEREMRTVFLSIAQREQAKRKRIRRNDGNQEQADRGRQALESVCLGSESDTRTCRVEEGTTKAPNASSTPEGGQGEGVSSHSSPTRRDGSQGMVNSQT